MLRTALLALTLGLPALAAQGPRTGGSLNGPPPPLPGNVVVIVTDDTGVDLIGAYESHFVSLGRAPGTPANTPAIDNLLAARGLLFTEGWVAPMCSPTRARILTGQMGYRNGVGAVIKENDTSGYDNPGLQTSRVLIPEVLQTAAPVPYTTAAVGKWHIVDAAQLALEPQHPLGTPPGRWFGRYAGSMYNLRNAQPGAGLNAYVSWIKSYSSLLDPNGPSPCATGFPPCDVASIAPPVIRYATADTTEDALAMIATLPEPFFLLVAYNAVHAPAHDVPTGLPSASCSGYTANPSPCYPGAGAPFDQRIRCAMEELDNQIGRLLCVIDETDTTVVLVGDNGTDPDATLPPFDQAPAKGTIYEGGVRVPFLIRSPLQVPGTAGRVSRALVNGSDIYATVMDIAGVTGPLARTPDSISMVPYLTGFTGSVRKINYTENFYPNFRPDPVTNQPPAGWVAHRHVQALRLDRYKLVRKAERDHGFTQITVTEQMFDLDKGGPVDPVTGQPTPDWFEQNDLLASGQPLPLRAQRALNVMRLKLDTLYPSLVQ